MKLEGAHPSHGKVVEIPERMRGRMGGAGTMVIPRPLDIDAMVRGLRKARVVTLSGLRERLAADSGVDRACPLTTGIFMRFVAEAAEEDRRAGKKRITPYWRVVLDDGSMNGKFPGGVGAQAAKLRAEGIRLVRGRGKKGPVVEGIGNRERGRLAGAKARRG